MARQSFMNLHNRAMKQKTMNAVEKFWIDSLDKAERQSWSVKDLNLPLARIKRLMKVEEEVKMVASEVPILFSKVAEIFVEELTLRAWINTEDNKRRILQKSDLSSAVKTSDIYDFLVFIVPRSELEVGYTEYEQHVFQPRTEDGTLNLQNDVYNTSFGTLEFKKNQQHTR